MILSPNFEKNYSEAIARFEELKSLCNPLLESRADEYHGSFGSRIKAAESLYSKIETGRYRRPFSVTDIYAATIALPVVSDIPKACERLLVDFEIVDRPIDRSDLPEVFVYDDLHLIVRLRRDNPIAPKSLSQLKFELQIKSLLQFAWSRATHETIYKAPEVSWQRDRLAAEARATLEVIDSLLDNVKEASALQAERDTAYYIRLKSILCILVTYWSPEQLPADLRRCAKTVDSYLQLADMTPGQLTTLLTAGDGAKYVSAMTLTPAQSVLATIIDSLDDKRLQTFCNKAKRAGIRFVITQEMQELVVSVGRLPEVSKLPV